MGPKEGLASLEAVDEVKQRGPAGSRRRDSSVEIAGGHEPAYRDTVAGHDQQRIPSTS